MFEQRGFDPSQDSSEASDNEVPIAWDVSEGMKTGEEAEDSVRDTQVTLPPAMESGDDVVAITEEEVTGNQPAVRREDTPEGISLEPKQTKVEATGEAHNDSKQKENIVAKMNIPTAAERDRLLTTDPIEFFNSLIQAAEEDGGVESGVDLVSIVRDLHDGDGNSARKYLDSLINRAGSRREMLWETLREKDEGLKEEDSSGSAKQTQEEREASRQEALKERVIELIRENKKSSTAETWDFEKAKEQAFQQAQQERFEKIDDDSESKHSIWGKIEGVLDINERNLYKNSSHDHSLSRKLVHKAEEQAKEADLTGMLELRNRFDAVSRELVRYNRVKADLSRGKGKVSAEVFAQAS
ncbi:MAG: hypothetical protein ABII72_02440 [Parcubacteria group bacterium]